MRAYLDLVEILSTMGKIHLILVFPGKYKMYKIRFITFSFEIQVCSALKVFLKSLIAKFLLKKLDFAFSAGSTRIWSPLGI